MKDFFIRLFNYDRFATESMLDALVNSNRPEKAVKLMAHTLAAQQIWFNRCKGLPPYTGALWQDDSNVDEFAPVLTKNHKDWIDYLETLNDEDFEKFINYKNLKGEPFESRLNDILMHIVNHGTHHRAQIGQQLNFAGAETLPVTDYIAYTRQLND